MKAEFVYVVGHVAISSVDLYAANHRKVQIVLNETILDLRLTCRDFDLYAKL